MPRRQRRHRFPFDSQGASEEMDELLANIPSKSESSLSFDSGRGMVLTIAIGDALVSYVELQL